MANVRLRLSDSIDAFSGNFFIFYCMIVYFCIGFVCKTKLADDLLPGILVSVDSLKTESLGQNKYE